MHRQNRLFTLLIILMWTICPVTVFPQAATGPFRAHLYNEEYKVAMHINFYEQDITIPGQELFGQMAGYMIRDGYTYCWLVVDAVVKDNQASLLMSNDYGSEDLKAELTAQGDSLYILRHVSGATLKVPNNGKWQKLPKTLELRPRKNAK